MYILAAVTIWAFSSGILVKYITVSPFTLYAIGAFFGILFLLGSLLVKKNINDLFKYPRKTLLLMVLVGLGIGINNGLYFTALKSGSIANAVLSHNLAPILVAFIFAPIILKEKLTLKTIFLVFLSFLGICILTIPTLHKSFDLALLYGVLSAIFYAFHTVIEKRVTQVKADPLTAVVYKNLVPFLMYAPFAVLSVTMGVSTSNWVWLAIWGILVLGVSFVFFFNGIKQIPATSASILSYGEPIGAIILAFLFFKQPINIYVITGGLLIIISGAIIVKTNK